MTTEQLVGLLLGMLTYFVLEFRAKGFQWGEINPFFWLRDNAWNLCSTALIIFVWTWLNSDSLTKTLAFFLGLGWNNIWDRLEDTGWLPKVLIPSHQRPAS